MSRADDLRAYIQVIQQGGGLVAARVPDGIPFAHRVISVLMDDDTTYVRYLEGRLRARGWNGPTVHCFLDRTHAYWRQDPKGENVHDMTIATTPQEGRSRLVAVLKAELYEEETHRVDSI